MAVITKNVIVKLNEKMDQVDCDSVSQFITDTEKSLIKIYETWDEEKQLEHIMEIAARAIKISNSKV